MNLIDTHTHLYWDLFKEDFDEVIKRSIVAGVTTVINVGVDVEKSKIAAELNSDKVKFYSTIGIHPHEALRYSQGKLSDVAVSIHQDIATLEQIYQSDTSKVIAVGECGLDFAVEETIVKIKQRQLFRTQIDLAKKLNLPLIVHCRDDRSKDPQNSEAWEEVLQMVSNHPAILHCYSGLPPTTKYILRAANFLVSFAGTITYPKNEYLREAVKILPLERIVLETDCPFLPPQSKRGQRNEPANILEIAQLIAELKGVSLNEVAHQTTDNVKKIFNI